MSKESDAENTMLLHEIRDALKELVSIARARKTANTGGVKVATDRELDDPKWGDPVVKFDPRDWTGNSCKTLTFSDCPPEYLDLLAESFDYFAEKNDRDGNKLDNGQPKSKYDKIGAAKARGWAARLRSGWKRPQVQMMDETPAWSENGGF